MSALQQVLLAGGSNAEVQAAALAYWDFNETDSNTVKTIRQNKTGNGQYMMREISSLSATINEDAVGATNGTGLRGSGNSAKTDITSNAMFGRLLNGSPITGSTQSYTICGWFKPTVGSFPQTVFRLAEPNSTTDARRIQVWLGFDNSGTAGSPYNLFFFPTQSTASFTTAVSSESVVNATWLFVAIQRNHSTNTARMRINNGAWSSTSISVANNTSANNRFQFGFTNDGATGLDKLTSEFQYWGIFNGALSDSAVDYLYNGGQGRTSAEIGLTTTYTDAYYQDFVSSLCHCDGTNGSTTLTDQKTRTWTANGNAQISTAQSKFGGASALFDGNGDYFQTATDAAAFNFYNRDFTIEAWIRITSQTNNFATVFGNGTTTFAGSAAYGMMCLGASAPGNARKVQFGGAAANPVVVSTSTLNTGQWYHIAITRSGNTFRLFVDGTQEASATNTNNWDFSHTNTRIGGNGWDGTAGNFDGYVDDLRITNGYARYTANFSPPSSAHPNS